MGKKMAIMLCLLMTGALFAGISGIGAISPVGKSYVAFLPRDNWHPYAGWYIMGQFNGTQYRIEVYNPTANTWDVAVDWTYIDHGDLHTHMNNLAGFWRTYRVISTKPIQAVVTSGEGSNMIPASTAGKYIGMDFTFLGNYRSSLYGTYPYVDVLTPYAAIVFGLADDTVGAVELWRDNGDGKFDLSNPYSDILIERREFALNKDEHFTFATWEEGTTFWRVTSSKDVLPIRTSGDCDEDDRAVSIEGRPFGKTFYFANPKNVLGPSVGYFQLGFRVRNMENTAATVKVYDIFDPKDPREIGTYTIPGKGLYSIPRSDAYRWDNYGMRYAKLESDRLVTVIAGQNMLRGDTIFPDPSITGDMKEYVTNMIYGHEAFIEDPFEEPDYNELVAVDAEDSIISINPSIDVSGRILQYYSASVKNKVYYEVDGTEREAVLNPGRGSFAFGANAFLTGFYVESGTNLVWGGIGNRGDEYSLYRWGFSSDTRFIFRQGGNGNCWILGIRAPDPWVEMDKRMEYVAGGFKFLVEIKNFGPQTIRNAQISDVLDLSLEYVEGSAYLDGVPQEPVRNGQELIFSIGEMSASGPLEPVVCVLEFEVKIIGALPDGGQNTAVVTYEYWEPYWGWTDKTMSDTEKLPSDPDTDSDGVLDRDDNCPTVYNPGQEDLDSDGIGDICDPDDDNDGIYDTEDNCPFIPNPDQQDTDSDGIGDICDPDDDNDGIYDTEDNCPLENPGELDANQDGCIDRLPDLADVVRSLELHHGIENSLVQKANNALREYNEGNMEDVIDILEAFINQVEAQRGKKIEEEDADMLIQFVRNIIQQIQTL
jgi:uncharacterized repeat protein (TIGR01451 family)